MEMKYIPACRGDGGYLFVSYAHRDSEDVYPVIEALIADGYRVWYDEGIDPGEDWANTIGSSLAKASLLMFFASKTSAGRENVMRELVFAKEHDIPILTVKMGDFEFSPDLERILLVKQVLKLQDFDTYNEFTAAIRPVLDKYEVRDKAASGNNELRSIILNRRIVFYENDKHRRKMAKITAGIAAGIAVLTAAFGLMFRTVPNVVELDVEKAQRVLKDSGFKYDISLNYSDRYEYGIITEQSKNGFCFRLVPVVLTQSIGPEENLTIVPDTVGQHISDGAAQLIEAGMSRFTIVSLQDTDREKAHIDAQSIPAGLRVSRKNNIVLDVASNEDGFTMVIDGKEYLIKGNKPIVVDLDELLKDGQKDNGNGQQGKNGNNKDTDALGPSATPTQAATVSPILTDTPDDVNTVTPTEAVATPPGGADATVTPVVTGTPAVTPTTAIAASPTEALVATPTAIPSATPTGALVSTPTVTPATTPTVTPVMTPTVTPAATPTAAASPTPEATTVATPTAAPSPTPEATPAITPTPTATPTPVPVAKYNSLGGGVYEVYNPEGMKAVAQLPMTKSEAAALGDEWFEGEHVSDSYSTLIRLMDDFTVSNELDGLWSVEVPSGRTLTIGKNGCLQACITIEKGAKIVVESGGRLWCTMGGEKCIMNYGTVEIKKGGELQSMFGGTFNNLKGATLTLNGTFYCGSIQFTDQDSGEIMKGIWFTNNGKVKGSGRVIVYTDGTMVADNGFLAESAEELVSMIGNSDITVTSDLNYHTGGD